MKLNNRVAVVTGGGKGIGKSISQAFADEGAKVIIAARDLSSLDETVEEITLKGGSADRVQTDIRFPDQVKHMVSYTLNKYGRIDVLVNNAAIAGPTKNMTDVMLDEWNDVMAINLTGPMLCTGEVLQHMINKKRGNIINIGSEGGRSGFPMRGPYAVSKRGIMALTETLAIEVGEYHIRVNCISPGRVRGERIENVVKAKAEAMGVPETEILSSLTADCSLKRLIEPSEVASAAVFLASEESSAITGHTLVVSCGKHMMH